MYICMLYVCMYVCMYVCIYVCTYACMYVYVYVCMLIFIIFTLSQSAVFLHLLIAGIYSQSCTNL